MKKTPFPLYAKHNKKLETKIEFVAHDSPESVVLGFFRRDYPKLTDEQVLKTKTDVKLLMGKKWKSGATVQEIAEWVRLTGVWGYCCHKSKHKKEIHYWHGKHADRISVFEFLLHEIYHAGGVHSEQRACALAGLGTFAFMVFERDFDCKK